jgi:hypothetical protein
MQQDHIQPEEIDLLLDGDEGFAVFPLRKHLAACDACRAKLDRARAVNDLLEHLPHARPRAGFAAGVMSRVQVFEPWHVSLADTVRRVIPRTGPWRVVTGLAVGGLALSLSTIAVWVSLRLDLAVYAAQLGWTRLQTASATTAGAAVSSMFGDSALTALRDGGTPAVVIGIGVLLGSLAAATIGLRGLIGAARRRGH